MQGDGDDKMGRIKVIGNCTAAVRMNGRKYLQEGYWIKNVLKMLIRHEKFMPDLHSLRVCLSAPFVIIAL